MLALRRKGQGSDTWQILLWRHYTYTIQSVGEAPPAQSPNEFRRQSVCRLPSTSASTM